MFRVDGDRAGGFGGEHGLCTVQLGGPTTRGDRIPLLRAWGINLCAFGNPQKVAGLRGIERSCSR